MKTGAVLESLRAPTFSVVSPHEEVKGIPMKNSPNRMISITFLFIEFLPILCAYDEDEPPYCILAQ
jgi:hypothetical protein